MRVMRVVLVDFKRVSSFNLFKASIEFRNVNKASYTIFMLQREHIILNI